MIKLHQMLHGYKLGHNYIQGSIVLSSSHDMDKIATLSDWSEYVGIDNKRDYITAYMLDESPYYVVAKTWYAENMKRPGCVWTHSLLIPKDDLSGIKDFRGLLYYFALPESEDFDSYSTQLDYIEGLNGIEFDLSEIGEKNVGSLYEYLLAQNPSFVLTEFSSIQSQELLLSLFNFLPAKILKDISVCSGTSSPRSYEGKYLSLQLVSHDGNSVKYLSDLPNSPWSQLVGLSVVSSRSQVSNLIKHYQDDIGYSKDKLIGFLSVIVLINRVCNDDNERQQVLIEIINTLSKTFPDRIEGNVFKRDALQSSLARDLGGELNFLYTFSTVDITSFCKEQIEYDRRVHELTTTNFLVLLKRLYTAETLNEWGNEVVNEVARYVSYPEIAELRYTDRIFFQTIICSSPDLLNQIDWSDFSKEDMQLILPIFSDKDIVNTFRHWRELFRIMLEQRLPIATELARMAFKQDIGCVDEYMTYLNRNNHQHQLTISRELENYPNELLSWMSNVSDINFDVAYILVNSIDEVSPLVRDRGSKIWIPFFNTVNNSSPVQFNIFLYRLSFNWQNDDALSFMKKSFSPIHELLKQDKLEYNLWYRIEPYTERLFLLQNWDKCKKLRKMVIRRLQEAGYPKSYMENYTNDEVTNEWLLKEW